jgi:hypothetical protein
MKHSYGLLCVKTSKQESCLRSVEMCRQGANGTRGQKPAVPYADRAPRRMAAARTGRCLAAA